MKSIICRGSQRNEHMTNAYSYYGFNGHREVLNSVLLSSLPFVVNRQAANHSGNVTLRRTCPIPERLPMLSKEDPNA